MGICGKFLIAINAHQLQPKLQPNLQHLTTCAAETSSEGDAAVLFRVAAMLSTRPRKAKQVHHASNDMTTSLFTSIQFHAICKCTYRMPKTRHESAGTISTRSNQQHLHFNGVMIFLTSNGIYSCYFTLGSGAAQSPCDGTRS